MELTQIIQYLETAPRTGRTEFGQHVQIPEAIVQQILTTLRSYSSRQNKRARVVGAKPQ